MKITNIGEAPTMLEHAEREFRLDVYVIDSGWDCPAHRLLSNSTRQFSDFLSGHNLYLLSREQSITFLRDHPDLIGKDPIVAVVDRLAKKLDNPGGWGVRLCLGMIQDPARLLWTLRLFARIVNTQTETLDIAHTFSKYSHKLGIQGAVEIIMDSVGGHNE